MLKWFLQLWNPKKSDSAEPSQAPEEADIPEVIDMPLEDFIDLHTFSPKEISSVTKTYLEEAHNANFTQVRIIHGKGKGIQRETVHSILKKHPLVESFTLAPPHQGGWGATIAVLKPKENGGTVD